VSPSTKSRTNSLKYSDTDGLTWDLDSLKFALSCCADESLQKLQDQMRSMDMDRRTAAERSISSEQSKELDRISHIRASSARAVLCAHMQMIPRMDPSPRLSSIRPLLQDPGQASVPFVVLTDPSPRLSSIRPLFHDPGQKAFVVNYHY
jgi:hypothetical protein